MNPLQIRSLSAIWSSTFVWQDVNNFYGRRPFSWVDLPLSVASGSRFRPTLFWNSYRGTLVCQGTHKSLDLVWRTSSLIPRRFTILKTRRLSIRSLYWFWEFANIVKPPLFPPTLLKFSIRLMRISLKVSFLFNWIERRPICFCSMIT